MLQASFSQQMNQEAKKKRKIKLHGVCFVLFCFFLFLIGRQETLIALGLKFENSGHNQHGTTQNRYPVMFAVT